jgi:hypothetical protein
LPTGGVTTSESAVYRHYLLSAPDLRPEVSKSYTYGVVFDSPGIERLTGTVDYFDIKIAGAIQEIGTTLIVRECLQIPSAETRSFCSLINRNQANGFISAVADERLNTGRREVSGMLEPR